MREVDISGSERRLATLRRRLENPERLLKRIGAVLVSAAERAFQQQRFGTIEWPARYPNQTEPKINIAGALADLAESGTIKGRRFDDRPALRDTGRLMNSLSSEAAITVKRGEVYVGTNVPYAGQHQEGGVSRQTVTQEARAALAEALERARDREDQDRLQALQKLGFLFSVPVLETRINPRPFLGVTPDAEDEIEWVVSDELKRSVED